MFISQIKASDGDRSPWGGFWFSPTSTSTMSGMRVSADTAMQLSAVYRAVALVSGHMAMLPIVFYESGTRKRIKKHPLLKLLNKRPNRYQNAFEWREMLQGHLELRGNAYNEIISNARGEIVELMPRHPDKVKIEQLDTGEYRYRITAQDGTSRTLARGEIWHIRGLSSNGITGLSVIECARESFGLGLAAQSYGARFFANDAKPSGGWIEYPGTIKDKESRLAVREQMQDAQSAANRGKLMVLDRAMKYHEVGVSNSDAQFLETKKSTISDIARWFGVPPHKIGDLEKATFSNIEQQALEYIQDALQPRGTRLEFSIEAELLFDDEEIDVEFDYKELLRGDSAARRAYYKDGILTGWLTRNEARLDEGRESLLGLDEPLRPLNMVEESDAEEQEDALLGGVETDQSDIENSGKSDSAMRLRAVLQANAARMARRIIKTGHATDDLGLIAEALAIPVTKAERWARETVWTRETFTVENITASLLLMLGEK